MVEESRASAKTEPSARRVAVIGGTGFLGHRVVAALAHAGAGVTLAARHSERRPDLPAARRVAANVRDRASLDEALEGASASANCVSLYCQRGELTFEEIHVRGARQWAEAAAAAGLERIALVSGIGADARSEDPYIRSRGEGEEAVRQVFPAATVVRPSVMFSRDGPFFGELRQIIRRSPVVPLFGAGRTRLQPVDVEDVAEAIVRILTAEDAPGRVYELGGPHIYTYREIIERLARKEGRRRALVPVPFPAWQALAAAGRVLPAPPITSGQVALMQKDNVVGQGIGTFADLGITPRGAEDLDLL